MRLKRGDVIVVNFPFSSGSVAKVRPALVAQNDTDNQQLTNVILVPVTTTKHRNGRPTQLLIEIHTQVGQQSGLLKDSVVACENVATNAQSLVRRKIGSLPSDTNGRD